MNISWVEILVGYGIAVLICAPILLVSDVDRMRKEVEHYRAIGARQMEKEVIIFVFAFAVVFAPFSLLVLISIFIIDQIKERNERRSS